nr:thioredoxin domain-containing protein [Desulforamulus ferrireducens]
MHWYPWGQEAFNIAKQRDLPIFLSIGYSTCHWCHVMERESFEAEDVAAILNQHFVSIKVDREERPDIDHIYMNVCQALTGSGGWPLTIVMTPEQKPFFAGTYFPRQANYGRPGLLDILEKIARLWQKDRQSLLEVGEKLASHLQGDAAVNTGALPPDILDKTYQMFQRSFDQNYGGFGRAPKFPTPHNLMFLLRYWHKTKAPQALSMVEETLDAMHRGGIYDHIGFGFSRYSTDDKWLVPHFEKMLYDNALLAMAYIETYQITGNPRFGRIAKEIFNYVLRDMTSPDGGFYSAEDADSEGEEGKFYVWRPEEITAILGEVDGELFCRYYDITATGNFEGASIPNLIGQDPLSFAAELDITLEELVTGMEKCRQQLFLEREKRIHPYKDDKILTSWNGLMIAALAKGARAFQSELYRDAAARATDFIWHKLRRTDGRLLARYREGDAAYPAYLEDYAFFVWGLLELYETTFEIHYLEKAVGLTQDMIDLFWDEKQGGFFFYGKDGEQLISRPKEVYDGAIPSGNSVATVNLLRLGRLTGNNTLLELAQQQLSTFAGDIVHYPPGHSFFMMAAYLQAEPPLEIILAGSKQDSTLKQMLRLVQQQFLPHAVVLVNYTEEDTTLPPLQGKIPLQGKATAYVCQNFACQAPISDLEELRQAIVK